MRIDSFDYELPEELIAQEPAARRSDSRLLLVDRVADRFEERRFHDLPALLDPGDLIVLNDARVEPLRLWARRPTGGVVEVLMLAPRRGDAPAGVVWEALVRPAKRVRPGERLTLLRASRAADPPGSPDPAAPTLRIVGDGPAGRRLVALPEEPDPSTLFDDWGQMPLPPYIRRQPHDARGGLDRERYQTVYARRAGAVAAPTAGLHFTDELFDELGQRGIDTATLTLQVGPGTFLPVRAEEVVDHSMEAEEYTVPAATVERVAAARRRGSRVVGVGTTVVRALEHAARLPGGLPAAIQGVRADLFVYPGFEFRTVDVMLTNFHLPRSTPILMAAAFAGRERLLQAYRQAVASRFRFYSYGDAMLIR